MNLIIVAFTILYITGIGFTFIKGFGLLSNKDNLLAVAYSYGLGVGLVSLQLFLYSRLNIPWQKELLILPWVIFGVTLFLLNRKKIKLRSLKFPKLNKIELILLLGIILTCSYTAFEAIIRPVSAWDAWATWLVESKVFFIDGKINPEIFNYLHSDYPLIFKLLGTFIYIMLGHVDDTAVLLISFAFYLFLGLLFFTVLKNKCGAKYSLLFTFLLLTIQNLVRHGGRIEAGLADLPLGYYSFICATLLFEYLKKSASKLFFLLTIFLGITILIKFEGIPISFFIGIFALYHIYKHKLYKHLLLLIFWIIPYVDWQIFRKINHVSPHYFPGHPLEFSWHKTANALLGTFKELINIKSWSLIWITYFYSLIAFGVKKNKELAIVHTIIISQMIVYLLTYIFTSGNNPESSIERLLVHIAPLALYAIAIIVGSSNLYDIIKSKLGKGSSISRS